MLLEGGFSMNGYYKLRHFILQSTGKPFTPRALADILDTWLNNDENEEK
jgi:hypothetical protein